MGPSRLRVSSVSWALGALCCVSGFSAPATAASGPRKPVVVSGSATNVGGVYTASASGAVIELPSRALLRVAPNAALRVFPLPQLLALTRGPRTWTWSFALQNGRVDVDLPKTGRGAVLASLGKLSAIITSGRCAFQVEDGETTTANLEGEVRTVLHDHWQTIPLGWIATLNKDDANAVAKPGLSAPTLNAGLRMWFATSSTVAMHGYHWAPVPSAAGYDLRLTRLSDGSVIDQHRTERTEWSDDLAGVEPGSYALALRSVDQRGMEGSWGPAAELRVIGVALPQGSYRTDQAIFLGAGQQVKFTHTEGLEMTYLGAGRYFPAVDGASLFRGQPTVVGFRMPGTLDTAVARLEPRGVYAEVRIGPQRALWPRDPILIDVQLKSRTGAEIPKALQVVPTVSLGLEPVDVNFERAGNTLHGVLAPNNRPGPWIVRVTVADQYGVELGHDFLEIAAQSVANSAPAKSTAPMLNRKPSKPSPSRGARGVGATVSHSATEPTVARSD